MLVRKSNDKNRRRMKRLAINGFESLPIGKFINNGKEPANKTLFEAFFVAI